MHFYDITMKDGTEHKGMLITDENGRVGNSMKSLVRDDPRVNAVSFNSKKTGFNLLSLKLDDIASAVCKEERVGPGVIKDVDELPMWLELHKAYVAHKAEIDALPEGERAAEAFMQTKRPTSSSAQGTR